jgi:two-component system, cell cycle response regulator DivK
MNKSGRGIASTGFPFAAVVERPFMIAPRVLVVDDNPINIDLVTHVLGCEGFIVDTAIGVDDASNRIAACRPDVVLLDIQMPEIDGLALARRLKADPSTAALPVIAFTAYAMKGDEEKMRAAGCDGYLAKPIDIATFAQSVRAYLKP